MKCAAPSDSNVARSTVSFIVSPFSTPGRRLASTDDAAHLVAVVRDELLPLLRIHSRLLRESRRHLHCPRDIRRRENAPAAHERNVVRRLLLDRADIFERERACLVRYAAFRMDAPLPFGRYL